MARYMVFRRQHGIFEGESNSLSIAKTKANKLAIKTGKAVVIDSETNKEKYNVYRREFDGKLVRFTHVNPRKKSNPSSSSSTKIGVGDTVIYDSSTGYRKGIVVKKGIGGQLWIRVASTPILQKVAITKIRRLSTGVKSNPSSSKGIYCYGCNKVFKTKVGFERHVHPIGHKVARKTNPSSSLKTYEVVVKTSTGLKAMMVNARNIDDARSVVKRGLVSAKRANPFGSKTQWGLYRDGVLDTKYGSEKIAKHWASVFNKGKLHGSKWSVRKL